MDVPQTCRRRAAATQVENSLSQFGLRQHVTNMFEFRVLFIPSLLIPSTSCCHRPKQQAGINEKGNPGKRPPTHSLPLPHSTTTATKLAGHKEGKKGSKDGWQPGDDAVL